MTEVRDRLIASDPGLLRLFSALSVVFAVVLTLGVLATAHAGVPILVAGALTAMVTTVAVTESRPRDQARTLAAGVPVALATIALGSALTPYRIAADAVFVVLIFGAIHFRRFGPRATTLGIFVFQLFFVTQFVGTRVTQLPALSAAVVVAFVSSAVTRFAVLRPSPARTMARLRHAFRVRLGFVLDALVAVAEGGSADDVRRAAARLHASALLIQHRLGAAGADAPVIQRRVAEAETAAERLAVLVLRLGRSDVDTLTRHLPVREREAVDDRDAAVLAHLIAELRAVRSALGSPPPDELRERLLGYRHDVDLPDASRALQDVFRSLGDFAFALFGLRLAAGGAREPARADTKENGAVSSARVRPTTRTALQVSLGSALAIAGGELLSPQRWYWAVFTCWVMFISTTSTGEILVRGYRRLLGTVAGVVAGLALAALIGDDPWLAFVLALGSVFGMYYTTAVSYTLMSFFVTTMIGMLYTLLHVLTPGVLVVRIEETALGVAAGLVAAALVLPVRTRDRTDQQLRTVLGRLRSALAASVARLSGSAEGDDHGDVVASARALDSALDTLRLSVQPLLVPVTPLRSRRRTARAVLGLLETAAFHVRSLAATADLVPAEARLAAEATRIDHNLDALAAHLDGSKAAVTRSAGVLVQVSPGAPAADANATRRALRHLQRVDESVLGLARVLDVPVTPR
ncbi:FUSC family protein [Amycolatopsis sp. FDAARGOS 1241]|uniref:FUSC family protein n=1 Tax=Amycolatopsis sp. FDAARGOS 1241 TaxID=2778070 RepID=UPI001951DF31|nr:FUSC family protein [Amycolatopsis sp. FDAARGOS 1241]QRP45138.1 FUSC family protein [Amycolatopsis sp. FDAARGOS 1241]